jgi:molybdopterin-guanine dinucleotide biosynthesis protein A
LVIADSQERADAYAEIVGPHIKFVLAQAEAQDSLAELVKAFEATTQKYALLVTANAPFLSNEILDLLFDLCPGRSAVIPRSPNAEPELLHAVYRVDAALEAAHHALEEGQFDLEGMVGKLRGVRYLSTLVVQELDDDLKTFFRVKGPVDLKRAEILVNPRKTKTK